MKKKNIFNLIAFIGIILLGVCSFLPAYALKAEGKIINEYTYKIWGGFDKEIVQFFKFYLGKFDDIWATIAMILFGIALVAGVIYIIFALINMLKKKSNSAYRVICMVCSIIILVTGILSFVFGAILFCMNNVYVVPVAEVVYEMISQVAFYLIPVGSILAGVFGLLASKKK